MMNFIMQTIAFSHPRRGLNGTFATFRLGARWADKLTQGETVDLVDARTKRPLLRAEVLSVHTGALALMAATHAKAAHNWQEHPEDERADLLLASMRRRFKHWGPSRTSDTAPCSVIFLREIRNETPP